MERRRGEVEDASQVRVRHGAPGVPGGSARARGWLALSAWHLKQTRTRSAGSTRRPSRSMPQTPASAARAAPWPPARRRRAVVAVDAHDVARLRALPAAASSAAGRTFDAACSVGSAGARGGRGVWRGRRGRSWPTCLPWQRRQICGSAASSSGVPTAALWAVQLAAVVGDGRPRGGRRVYARSRPLVRRGVGRPVASATGL